MQNDINTMLQEVEEFIDSMRTKYDTNISIVLGGRTHKTVAKNISTLREEAYNAMIESDPALSKYPSMRTKNRAREFLNWLHCYMHIATTYGYNYSEIARDLFRSHATIIAAVKKVNDLLDVRDPEIYETYKLLQKHYAKNVGILPKDIKG